MLMTNERPASSGMPMPSDIADGIIYASSQLPLPEQERVIMNLLQITRNHNDNNTLVVSPVSPLHTTNSVVPMLLNRNDARIRPRAPVAMPAPNRVNQLVAELMHVRAQTERLHQLSTALSALEHSQQQRYPPLDPLINGNRPAMTRADDGVSQLLPHSAHCAAGQQHHRTRGPNQSLPLQTNQHQHGYEPLQVKSKELPSQPLVDNDNNDWKAIHDHHDDNDDDNDANVQEEDGSFAVSPTTTVVASESGHQQTRKNDSKWLSNLEELKSYKRAHGDCIVPRGYVENPRLANWVAEQRKQFNLFQDGKQSSITQDRIDVLNELGFTWSAQEAAWVRQVSDLKRFRQEKGHCNVPLRCDEYPKLGLWVKEKRRHYALMKQGKRSPMTPKRAKELEAIGMDWDVQRATWTERLMQLTDFKQKYGHCNIPARFDDSPKLSRWVRRVRRQYKLYQKGDESVPLTAERVQALEDLGFDWGGDPTTTILETSAAGSDSDSDSDSDVPFSPASSKVNCRNSSAIAADNDISERKRKRQRRQR